MAGENNVEQSKEQLLAEITRLRQLNKAQNDQLAALRTQVAQNTGNASNQLVTTLVDGLKNMNLDVKPQKFDETENANQFVERLEKYYTTKSVPENNWLNVLDSAFEGRARAWFETKKSSLVNYQDFKNKFLAEFFSIPVRVNIKSAWLARRFEGSSCNLQTYFINQVREAQYFIPRLDDYELYYTIIQQMPMRTRESLATVDYSNFDKISQALAHLDLSFQEKINNRKQNMPGSNNVSNSNSQNRGNKFRNQRGQAGEQRGNSQANVVSSHIHTNYLIDNQAQRNSYRHLSSPRVPLPDTSRPPPSNPLQVNGSFYFANNLNY